MKKLAILFTAATAFAISSCNQTAEVATDAAAVVDSAATEVVATVDSAATAVVDSAAVTATDAAHAVVEEVKK